MIYVYSYASALVFHEFQSLNIIRNTRILMETVSIITYVDYILIYYQRITYMCNDYISCEKKVLLSAKLLEL
jgi:hypothetical protein